MYREAHHSLCDTVAPSRSSTFTYSPPSYYPTNLERFAIPLSSHFPYVEEPLFMKYAPSKTKSTETRNNNSNCNNIVNELSKVVVNSCKKNVNGVTSHHVNTTPNYVKNENYEMKMGKGNNNTLLNCTASSLSQEAENPIPEAEFTVTALRFPIIDWNSCATETNSVTSLSTSEEYLNNGCIKIPSWRLLPGDSSDEDTSDEAYIQRHFKPEVLERKQVNRARGFRLPKKSENDIYHLQNFLKKSSHFKKVKKTPEVIHPMVIENVIREYLESIHCMRCRKGDKEDLLLLCDVCNNAVHTFCHNPPLTEIPSGTFICETCSCNKTKKKKTRPKKRKNKYYK